MFYPSEEIDQRSKIVEIEGNLPLVSRFSKHYKLTYELLCVAHNLILFKRHFKQKILHILTSSFFLIFDHSFVYGFLAQYVCSYLCNVFCRSLRSFIQNTYFFRKLFFHKKTFKIITPPPGLTPPAGKSETHRSIYSAGKVRHLAL